MPRQWLLNASSKHPRSSVEALLLVDIVQFTPLLTTFGDVNARRLVASLRRVLAAAVGGHPIACARSTGDGVLLTIRHRRDAELAVISATEIVLRLFDRLRSHNARVPEQCKLRVRVCLHFGQVEVSADDRHGRNIVFLSRMESVDRDSLRRAIKKVRRDAFPASNYLMCSETAKNILQRRSTQIDCRRLGFFELRGFPGLHPLFIVRSNAKRETGHHW